MRVETALPQLLPVLLAGLPDLLDEVGATLHGLDPSYAEFLTNGRDEVLPPAQLAVRNLVGDAIACLAGPEVPASAAAGRPEDDLAWALFEEVGRDAWRRDQPVRTLLSAYQLGGRVGWRRIAALAVDAGLPADALAALAEAVFRLVDQLGAATTAGYVEEQAQSVVAREQVRDELAERLLSDRSGSASVEQAARLAGWSLPAEAAIIFLHPDDEPGRAILARMAPVVLPLRHTPLPGAIVPDPAAPGQRQRLVGALRGTTALIGPTVALADLPESARDTEAAAATLDSRTPENSPVFVTEHLDAIIVHRDRRLLSALREDTLRPLAQAAPSSRDALCRTLRSWLVQMGNRQAMAEELGVHPQTVRYRMGRLRELFGPALDDPAVRMRLLLALGWEPGPDALVSRLETPAALASREVSGPPRGGPREPAPTPPGPRVLHPGAGRSRRPA